MIPELDPWGTIYNPELTWSQLADVLEKAILAETPTVPAGLPANPDDLIALLAKSQKRLDELCDAWALTGTWPLMHPIEAWLLQHRLRHGLRLAVRLDRKHAHGQTLPVPGMAAGLRWLIADSYLLEDLQELVAALASEPPHNPPPAERLPPLL